MRPQLILDLHDELIVDNFAGGGGASTGIELALGRSPDIAINHDREALALHAMNHPQTQHLCEDVFKVDPVLVCAGRKVGLAWFSPDCKHFSKAKGGKPRSKKIRGLAWVAVKWAATVKPRVIVLENVEEFQKWGPLLPDGRPCPLRKGKTFRNFIKQLENHGYQVEWRELRACDYGAPTIRKRLFLIARCDGQPIVWPAATHAAPDKAKALRLRPWRTAAECIDFSLPCPSIFLTPAEARPLGVKRPLAEATMRRIARGVYRYVLTAKKPFVVRVAHGEASAGVKRRGSGGHFAAVAPTLIQTGYGERPGQAPRVPGVEKPLGTAVDGQKHAVVAAFLAKHQSERNPRDTNAAAMTAPVPTVKAVDSNAVVSATLIGAGGPAYSGEPRPVDAPVGTVLAENNRAIGVASLVRQFGESTGQPADEPCGTVMPGGGGKTALSVSHLSKFYGTATGADLATPMPTPMADGNHLSEVRAFLQKYYGEGGQDQSLWDPTHTVPTKDRIALVTVEGVEYEISDIGMRMLEPRELYLAQGFPPGFIIDRAWFGEGETRVLKVLPKHAQVRMCGNSVCPPLARALVAANVPEMVVNRREAARPRRASAAQAAPADLFPLANLVQAGD